MTPKTILSLKLETPNLHLIADEAYWDTAIFGCPVAQIKKIAIVDAKAARHDFSEFKNWLDVEHIGIVSCRLHHDQLRESMFLEEHGFRFIEIVLHPKLDNLQTHNISTENLKISPAEESDLFTLISIAQQAFGHERFHIDPRIDPYLADQRYGRWVANTLDHPSQILFKILDNDRLIGFFIVENLPNHSIYWHLTAISPQWQGCGYGRRVWRAMLHQHQSTGIETVTTTIAARNTAVLNLYSQLNFRFTPPEMTFHWVRQND